jgi:hypothetical protein
MQNEITAFVCSHIFRNESPILLVSKQDGDWQFLCGAGHAEDAIPHVVGLNHLLGRDSTLTELLDLPDDWEAERTSKGSPWHRFKGKE